MRKMIRIGDHFLTCNHKGIWLKELRLKVIDKNNLRPRKGQFRAILEFSIDTRLKAEEAYAISRGLKNILIQPDGQTAICQFDARVDISKLPAYIEVNLPKELSWWRR